MDYKIFKILRQYEFHILCLKFLKCHSFNNDQTSYNFLQDEAKIKLTMKY